MNAPMLSLNFDSLVYWISFDPGNDCVSIFMAIEFAITPIASHFTLRILSFNVPLAHINWIVFS